MIFTYKQHNKLVQQYTKGKSLSLCLSLMFYIQSSALLAARIEVMHQGMGSQFQSQIKPLMPDIETSQLISATMQQ